jgi:Uma2 family endonuclease
MEPLTVISKKNVVPDAPKVYTLWEYLAREERSKDKHEFYDGKIVKMSNAKYNHNLIAANMLHFLRIELYKKEKKYIVLGDGQKIYVELENVAVYPDAIVIFEKPVFYQERTDILLNPIVIVEVLSRTTALYDRTAKFDLYQTIPSFKEYILIDHKKISVETRFREADDLWRVTKYYNENLKVNLKSLEVELAMNDVYENVNFENS